MKKLLVFISALFICTVAFAHTINWHVDDQIITTTCSAGDNITPPTAPTKLGYHFVKWAVPYTQLEYIESTGTQYIDTGLHPQGEDKTEFVSTFSSSSYSGDEQVCGAYDGRVRLYLFGWFTNAFRTTEHAGEYNNNKVALINVSSFNTNTFLPVRTILNNGFASITVGNETSVNYSQDTDFPGNVNLYLFARNMNGRAANFASAKLKRTQISVNDVLVRDLVPAKRNIDNAIGMYDTVTQTFFENQGAGTFIAGPAVGYIQ